MALLKASLALCLACTLFAAGVGTPERPAAVSGSPTLRAEPGTAGPAVLLEPSPGVPGGSARAPIAAPGLELAAAQPLPAPVAARSLLLDGLLLRQDARAEELEAWYADRDGEDLVRCRHRLARLQAALSAKPAPAFVPGEIEIATVEAELAFVDARIGTALPPRYVHRVPGAAESDLERHYRGFSPEDLEVEAWRLATFEAAERERVFERLARTGPYEVVPGNALWG